VKVSLSQQILTPSRPGPFALDPAKGYQRWRDAKLAACARAVSEFAVDVSDPELSRDSEREALRLRIARNNMVIYRLRGGVGDKDFVRRLGESLGLKSLDTNPYADEDQISALSVRADAAAKGYIPYTNRALNWHTDGYYNPPERRIGAFIMHCVRPAAEGGENGLLDHELAYLLLRERDPALVEALMDKTAMTIPPNTDEGTGLRGAQTGPVFSVIDGVLHMRYTARTRSIQWKETSEVQAAAQALRELLSADCPYRFTYRLAAGEGIVCNNVLHSRAAYRDDPNAPRLLLRARYHERAAGI
jgi:hypothetical protein